MTKREKYKLLLKSLEEKLKNAWGEVFMCNELKCSAYPELSEDWQKTFAPTMKGKQTRRAWLNTTQGYADDSRKANALRLEMLKAKAYGKSAKIKTIKAGIQERYEEELKNYES